MNVSEIKHDENGKPIRYTVYSGATAYYATDHRDGSEASLGDGVDVLDDVDATEEQICEILQEALNDDQDAADSLTWVSYSEDHKRASTAAWVGAMAQWVRQ